MHNYIDLLRDSIWQFIGVLITMLSFAFAIWIYAFRSLNKTFYHHLVNMKKIYYTDGDDIDQLTTTFNNKVVKNVSEVVIKIGNSGNLPIEEKDFRTDIEFFFDGGHILSKPEILDANPNELRNTVRFNQKKWSLKPILLNPGDWIEIKFFVTEMGQKINLTGRIRGIRNIIDRTRRRHRIELYFFQFTSISMSAIVGSLGMYSILKSVHILPGIMGVLWWILEVAYQITREYEFRVGTSPKLQKILVIFQLVFGLIVITTAFLINSGY